MKKNIIVALTLVLFVFTANSFAYEGARYYASGNLGMSLLFDTDVDTNINAADGELSFEAGFNLSGAFGLDTENWRFEGELRYQQSEIDGFSRGTLTDSGDVSVWSLMANAYYDFNLDSNFVPYLSGGLGFADVSLDNFSTSANPYSPEDGLGLAWQLGVGLAYMLNNAVAIDLGYRFMGIMSDAGLLGHNFTLGARYLF